MEVTQGFLDSLPKEQADWLRGMAKKEGEPNDKDKDKKDDD